jgi:flap endonuclease-1
MGIKNLTKLLQQNAPEAFKEEKGPQAYTGTKVAIDASMALYQFMVAVRSIGSNGNASMQLTNEAGEVTSHIQGFFSRTIRLLERGVKPVWVFDGKAPDLKGGELAKRKEAKEKAKADLKEAIESGDVDAQNKLQKRTVRVTKEHNEDIKTLLRLMGCPVVEAPCEAEAQCAALAKQGHVFASASEDMDTLTFGTPKLLRKFTAPESKKIPVMEINLQRALEGLQLSMDEFIDLCILCGCDYMDSIKGVGSKTAYKLIKEHGTLEKVLAQIRKDGKGHTIPDVFPIDAARELFKNHPVIPSKEVDIKFTTCNEPELKKFLVEAKGFNPERIAKQIERLKKVMGKKQQRRMDSFFTAMPGKKRVLPNKGKGKGKNAKKKKVRR